MRWKLILGLVILAVAAVAWWMASRPRFDSMRQLDGPYMEVVKDGAIGVYNSETKVVELRPTVRCSGLVAAGEKAWRMLDREERPYREFRLPQAGEEFESWAVVDENGDASIDYIRDIAEEFEPYVEGEDDGFKRIYRRNREAYAILGKIVRSSGCENTPVNNLHWKRAIDQIIAESGLDREAVFNAIDEFTDYYDGGCQGELNQSAYIRQVLAHYRQLGVVDSLLKEFPVCRVRYDAWSRAQAARIEQYIEYMYEANHYSSLPMDVAEDVTQILDEATARLRDPHGVAFAIEEPMESAE